MRYNKQDIFEVYGWTDLDTYIHICVDAHVLSHISCVQLCMTLCHTDRGVYQAPLSMGFSRQEYWSGLPFPLPRDLSDLGIELVSLTSPELAGWICIYVCICETITAIKIVSTSIPC